MRKLRSLICQLRQGVMLTLLRMLPGNDFSVRAEVFVTIVCLYIRLSSAGTMVLSGTRRIPRSPRFLRPIISRLLITVVLVLFSCLLVFKVLFV